MTDPAMPADSAPAASCLKQSLQDAQSNRLVHYHIPQYLSMHSASSLEVTPNFTVLCGWGNGRSDAQNDRFELRDRKPVQTCQARAESLLTANLA